jgi:hypothetical protein
MGEATQEEMINIANNFLLNSPPGEFMEVVTGKYPQQTSTLLVARILF